MISGSKACVAGLCQPQWQRDERNCSTESLWGNGEHSVALPTRTCGSWWTQEQHRHPASGSHQPLGGCLCTSPSVGSSPFSCPIQSSPAFPCKEQVAICFFPCLGLTSSTQGLASPDANAQFYLLFPFLQLFSPCVTQHLPGLALTSSAERFQANKKPLKGLRSQSNEKGWALAGPLETLTPRDHLVTNAQEKCLTIVLMCLVNFFSF